MEQMNLFSELYQKKIIMNSLEFEDFMTQLDEEGWQPSIPTGRKDDNKWIKDKLRDVNKDLKAFEIIKKELSLRVIKTDSHYWISFDFKEIDSEMFHEITKEQFDLLKERLVCKN